MKPGPTVGGATPAQPGPCLLVGMWVAIAGLLLALALVLLANRHRFDWALELGQIPALALMAGLIAAGLAFQLLLPVVCASEHAGPALTRPLLALVLAVGLLLRLIMFATEPALEDDQQRYLFEGGMTAHGLSPYRYAPADAARADRASALGQLAAASGPVIDRVNHAELKSIYPPVAQAAFALAYRVGPFNLTAWRGVLLAADCALLWMLLRMLAETGRAPLWAALYWWNPIVIKEVFNSGHMEGILMPLVAAAVWLAMRRRFLWSTAVLGLAAGVKIWPVLLAPVLLRPLVGRWRMAGAAVALLAGLGALWAWPILAGGIDARSGFTAYAERWQANSALLPALRGTIQAAFDLGGVTVLTAGRAARIGLAAAAIVAALGLAWRPIEGPADVVRRAGLVTLALALLSPAQFPWYMLWTLPFLPFAPRWGVVAMAALLPIYYASFHFSALDAYNIFRDRVVWVIWLPIWGLLALEALAGPDRGARVHARAKGHPTEDA